jgi:thioredoxin reductase
MRYDVDLVVVGAGPAGLAASIRARWVKTSYAVPASVLLLDPAGIGGIAAMGNICLTGPSFGFRGSELIARLRADVEHLEIPVLREAAVGLAQDGQCWIVQTPERAIRCLAVILATGLRRLSNEALLASHGFLTFLAGGYTSAARRFHHWSIDHMGQRMALIGGASMASETERFRQSDQHRNTLIFLCEPTQRVLAYRQEGETIQLTVDDHGAMRQLEADHVMIDYHSLERTPPSLLFLPATYRTAQGYSQASPRGMSSAPGLFAAGDCTGPPSLCIKSLAEGSEAAFNALRYVHEIKFGVAPHLFAFYPSHDRPSFGESELPHPSPTRHIPVGLTASSHFAPHGNFAEPLPMPRPLTPEEWQQVEREIHEKTATVHLADEE